MVNTERVNEMTARPIGVDLFSGAGGLSLGFEQAGFDVVAAVEYDPIHAATHAYNFPKTAVLARSVVGLSGAEIRDKAGIKDSTVDVVFGGAPCQGFSLIGKRALNDPRNLLVREFVRIVAELRATYFVFENVKGLTVGQHKEFLRELIEAFSAAGYSVTLPWRVLDASNFGVPQHRERLFLLGARNGAPTPKYPRPTTNPAGGNVIPGLPSGPTCSDALRDLPNAEDFGSLLISDHVRTKRWGQPSEYAAELRGLGKFPWFAGYKREWDSALLTSSARTDHSPISRRRFAETLPGQVEPISRFFRLPIDGVSNTLRAGTDGARGAFTSPRPIHFAYPRCITVREMARLHSFPDWFRFHATKWHGARQVGNAVPPALARAVATEIISALGLRVRTPREVLELGEPALLELEMRDAAAKFGIQRPIGGRTYKSGQRKRKQHEIESERLLLTASTDG